MLEELPPTPAFPHLPFLDSPRGQGAGKKDTHLFFCSSRRVYHWFVIFCLNLDLFSGKGGKRQKIVLGDASLYPLA